MVGHCLKYWTHVPTMVHMIYDNIEGNVNEVSLIGWYSINFTIRMNNNDGHIL